MGRRSALLILGLALAARLIHLASIRALPWFETPIVDGANYARLARAIAAGNLLGGSAAFWQPPLYSYFMALPFALFGPRMLPVYLLQAGLGALTCLLTAQLAALLYGARAGIAAGILTALWGPLVYFDLQPLIPVLHLALAAGGLLLVARAGLGGGGRAAWAGGGALFGLAAIATPGIALTLPAIAAWGRRRSGSAAALLFGLAAALPILAVGARNLLVAGEPVLVSSNGGINFFIGNNADYDRTVRARPGGDFERIAQEPGDQGVVGGAMQSRWFTARAVAFLRAHPGPALRLYGRKALDLIAGREIPRNENMYDYRATSPLLTALLWRAGVACPFGLVAPLALAGLVAVGMAGRGAGGTAADPARSGTALLLLYSGFYAASILLFFPTDRYRLPLVPILAIFAGRALAAGVAAWRGVALPAAVAVGLVLFNLDARVAQESWPEEAALNRAYALRAAGRTVEARDAYLEARRINPRRLDPHNALGALAAAAGDWPAAEAHYRDLVALAPDFPEAHALLGRALAEQGRTAEARAAWVLATRLVPAAGLALAELSLSHLEEGVLETAFDYGTRAVAARPDLPETHFARAMAARALRRRDIALAELEEAARLFPPGSEGGRRAAEILDRMRRAGAPLASEGG